MDRCKFQILDYNTLIQLRYTVYRKMILLSFSVKLLVLTSNLYLNIYIIYVYNCTSSTVIISLKLQKEKGIVTNTIVFTPLFFY